jgi:cytochrome P450
MEVLDIAHPFFRRNPYPEFERVREKGPLCRVEPFGIIGITRHADVLKVVQDPKTFSSMGIEKIFPPLVGAELFTQGSVLLASDPPAHTKIRRLVQRAFTIKEMERWQSKIEALTARIFDRLEERSNGVLPHDHRFELMGEVATPLPVAVISEMLGVDPSKEKEFKRWSDDIIGVRTVQLSADPSYKSFRQKEIQQSCLEFKQYFSELIELRRRDPSGHDLISQWVRAAADGEILRSEDIMGLCRLLLVAGNETTTHLVGNMLFNLMARPDIWGLLRANPDLAERVVEEALRFDGPALFLMRRVVSPTVVAGVHLEAGSFVAPLLASANHDPRVFQNPSIFDPFRPNIKEHLAFGTGIHLCVGAPLARMEAASILRQMVKRFPNISLKEQEVPCVESFLIKGHQRLWLNTFKAQGQACSVPMESSSQNEPSRSRLP